MRMPCRCQAASCASAVAQHPARHQARGTGAFGDGNEFRRRNIAEFRMLPAQQRLHAARRCGRSCGTWAGSAGTAGRTCSACGRSAPSCNARRCASSLARSNKACGCFCWIAVSSAASAQRSSSFALLPWRGASAAPSTTAACSVMPAVARGRRARSRRSASSACSAAVRQRRRGHDEVRRIHARHQRVLAAPVRRCCPARCRTSCAGDVESQAGGNLLQVGDRQPAPRRAVIAARAAASSLRSAIPRRTAGSAAPWRHHAAPDAAAAIRVRRCPRCMVLKACARFASSRPPDEPSRAPSSHPPRCAPRPAASCCTGRAAPPPR